MHTLLDPKDIPPFYTPVSGAVDAATVWSVEDAPGDTQYRVYGSLGGGPPAFYPSDAEGMVQPDARPVDTQSEWAQWRVSQEAARIGTPIATGGVTGTAGPAAGGSGVGGLTVPPVAQTATGIILPSPDSRLTDTVSPAATDGKLASVAVPRGLAGSPWMLIVLAVAVIALVVLLVPKGNKHKRDQ
jgi:hypothetical protein